jgi:hypothetical protein
MYKRAAKLHAVAQVVVLQGGRLGIEITLDK